MMGLKKCVVIWIEYSKTSLAVYRENIQQVFFPLMNISEDKDSFYIRSELPGMKANELDISVTADSLSISGERKIPEESGQAKYHRREREAGKFNRVVTLPGQIDPNSVEANSVDGVLTITLPKAEISQPRQITVKAS